MADNIEKLEVEIAREHAINIYRQSKPDEDRKAAVRNLYHALRENQPFAEYMQASDMTEEEMYRIVERLRDYGWAQGIYMPIASFSHKKPLEYVLSHKQELLGKKGFEAFSDSFIALRRFFVGPMG